MSTISCSPTYIPVGLTNVPFQVFGVGTTWTGTGPTFTFTPSSGSAPVLTGGAVQGNLLFAGGVLSTVGCTVGATVTLTDTTTSDTYTITLVAPSYVPAISAAIPTAGVELSTLPIPGGGGWAVQGYSYGVGQYVGTMTTQAVATANAGTVNMAYNPDSAIAQYLALDGPMTGLDSSGSITFLTLTPTDNSLVGALVNFDPAANTGLIFIYRYASGTPVISIFAKDANVSTAIATANSITLTANTVYTLKWNITNALVTVSLYLGASLQTTISTSGITLGSTANTPWLPGWTGAYINSTVGGSSGATPTTGWRVGPITATTGPRMAPLQIQSGTNWPFAQGLTITHDYAVAISQNFIGATQIQNYYPQDQHIWLLPLATPLAVPTSKILLNNGSGSGAALINRGAGGAIAMNCIGLWITNAQVTALGGTPSGPTGRFLVIWSEFQGSNWEQCSQPGNSSAAHNCLTYTSYCDDLTAGTPTFVTPTDITTQFKNSGWCSVEMGPSNCMLLTQDNKIMVAFWVSAPNPITGTVSGTSGGTTLTSTVSGATGVAGATIVLSSGDTTHQYKIANTGVSGTTWTLDTTGAGQATGTATTLQANISGATASITSFGNASSTWASLTSYSMTTTDPTGRTGWTLGGSPGNLFTPTSTNLPNEIQITQLSNGTILAVQRINIGTTKFATSTDDGTTWTVYTPSSFPYTNAGGCTVGLLTLPGGTLLFSGNAGSSRTNLTLGVSTTNGSTWNSLATPAGNLEGTEVETGAAGYSTLQVMPSGNVLMVSAFGPIGSLPSGPNAAVFAMTPAWLGPYFPNLIGFDGGFDLAYEGGFGQ